MKSCYSIQNWFPRFSHLALEHNSDAHHQVGARLVWSLDLWTTNNERESQSGDLLGGNNNRLEGRDIMNSQAEGEHNELQITLNLDTAPHHCTAVAVN